MISDEARAVMESLRSQRIGSAAPISIQAARDLADERLAAIDRLPDGATAELGVGGGVATQTVRVNASRCDRCVVLVHGGGYVSGSLRSHQGFAARVAAAARASVVQVGYRLAPEHPFPAALDDTVRTYQHLVDTGQADGSVALVGDSAGGGLVVSALRAIVDRQLPVPAAAAVISPWADLTLSGRSLHANAANEPKLTGAQLAAWASLYAASASTADPRLSPVFGDLSGLPPVLIQVGSHELLLSDADRLAASLRAAGVLTRLSIVEGMFHGFQLYPALPEARAALDELGRFLELHLEGAS